MPTELHFLGQPTGLDLTRNLVLIGKKARLADATRLLPAALAPLWGPMVDSLSPGDAGDSTSTWVAAGETQRRVVVAALPESASRHNSPCRPDAIASLVGKHTPKSGDGQVVILLDRAEDAFAAGCAAGRVFPLFSRKSSRSPDTRQVTVHLLPPDWEQHPVAQADLSLITNTVAGIRLVGRLVDAPTAELTTDDLVAEATRLGGELGAEVTVIHGQELFRQGFGGLYGVGRAAVHQPALVHLRHSPAKGTAARTVVWVGKGIVYDTGGLSLKSKSDMPGMKADMGGAAAVLGAFSAAVRSGFPDHLHAILCLAENAVGPEATRPDDVLTLYSGKTVEINNTDAEGRLVLADGVAYAARHLAPDVLVDLATLTGAQLVATGKRHAAIVCTDEELERRAVAAGKLSGELVHPLPYCPEFYRKEFKSEIADLKNSVKDRMNAQTSCAAQFIAEHLLDYKGPWLHVDLAGPVVLEERGTGFGVGLLVALFMPRAGESPVAQGSDG